MVHIGEIDEMRATPARPAQWHGHACDTHDKVLLEGIFDAIPSPIAALDASGLIVCVNHAWLSFAEEYTDKVQAYGVGNNYLEVVRARAERGDGSAAHALVGLRAVLRGEKPSFELEFPCQGPCKERWFLMQVSPLAAQAGCVVLHVDITARKKMEQDKARLASILEATTDYVGIADVHGRELYANRALRQLRGLGLSPHDPLGNVIDCHPESDYRKIVEEGMPEAARMGVWSAEVAVRDASGREIPVHQLILAHPDATGKIDFYSTIMRDISETRRQADELRRAYDELKRTQEQMVHSEKLASIGQLAAGVAHEINNPIGYLHSNLGTLGQYVQDVLAMVTAFERAVEGAADPVCRAGLEQAKRETDFAFLVEDIPKLLEESQEGIQRVRKIVQDLKDFAHAGDNEDWQWQDLRHSLKRTLNIVHNELKYKAEVHLDCEDIPEIRCLPGQLNQVFMNLLVNAAHAIESNGVVRVRTWHEAGWVWVAITDTGCGIPQGVIDRIFDPFFTTKPVGKGTGLGLSISYGIVKKHGGRIEVESQVGRGTTFRVGLPVEGPEDAE
jgi:two-component system NtrC family sensor kinase